MKSRRDLYTLLTSRLDSCIITIYNIISTRIMYEEDLDSINNLDEEYAYTYDLDENYDMWVQSYNALDEDMQQDDEYARDNDTYEALAYRHYA